MKRLSFLTGVMFLISGFTLQSPPAQTQNGAQTVAPTANNPGTGAILASMKNVDFHLTDRIIVHIVKLDGSLSHDPDKMVDFDDKTSFAIDVNSASVSISTTALSNDLNDYVFARADAPIKKLSATTKGNELTLKGLLVSKGGVPFESTGTLSVTPDGLIHVHTTKIKALHVPVKGLMDMLGMDTTNMLNTKKVAGVSVDKNDLILDPQLILPPPQLHGHLTSINIENDALVLAFGPVENATPQRALTNNCGARNYLQFKGGSVRFGKLTMTDADLLLMDMQPADPFDFAIDHYKEQLVAGYAKTTQQGGLCVHMPDLNKLKEHK
jgi:hypothetical protein